MTLYLHIYIAHTYTIQLTLSLSHPFMHTFQTSLGGFQEEAVEALNNKNPSVKAEALLFLCRCFQQCTPAMIPKPLLKAEVPLIVQVDTVTSLS